MSIVIDRTLFLPSYASHFAKTDDAVYMGKGRWVQSPSMADRIVKYLDINKCHKILEVGCSSGYQTAVLSRLCHSVFTIDCDKDFLNEAMIRFDTLELENIETIHMSYDDKFVSKNKYDRIVLSLATDMVDLYLELLEEDGVLIAPMIVDENYQVLTLFRKSKGEIENEDLEQCMFVSMKDIQDKYNKSNVNVV